MSARVLFVCSGNTCRSPLAEAMARRLAETRGLRIEMASAGTSAAEGLPASDGSLLVGVERQLDLSAHRSRLLTAALVHDATLILALAPHHAARAVQLGGADKTSLLADFAEGKATGRGISDPYGSGLDAYRQMADELEALLPAVIDRLAAGSAEDGTASGGADPAVS